MQQYSSSILAPGIRQSPRSGLFPTQSTLQTRGRRSLGLSCPGVCVSRFSQEQSLLCLAKSHRHTSHWSECPQSGSLGQGQRPADFTRVWVMSPAEPVLSISPWSAFGWFTLSIIPQIKTCKETDPLIYRVTASTLTALELAWLRVSPLCWELRSDCPV